MAKVVFQKSFMCFIHTKFFSERANPRENYQLISEIACCSLFVSAVVYNILCLSHVHAVQHALFLLGVSFVKRKSGRFQEPPKTSGQHVTFFGALLQPSETPTPP